MSDVVYTVDSVYQVYTVCDKYDTIPYDRRV